MIEYTAGVVVFVVAMVKVAEEDPPADTVRLDALSVIVGGFVTGVEFPLTVWVWERSTVPAKPLMLLTMIEEVPVLEG